MSHLRSINPSIASLLLLAAGLGVAALSLTGGRAGDGKPRANPIDAAQVRPVSVEQSGLNSEQTVEPGGHAGSIGEFVGVTIARETIEVGAPSEGRLEAVYVNLGDRLKSGDRVARLNTNSLNRQLAMARASLDAAESEELRTRLALAEAEDRRSRRRTLAAEGLISREEVVSAELQIKMAATNIDEAKARVAERQAQVAQIQDSLSDAELRAPFAGIVAARLANPGSIVHPGSPVVSLIREDDLWVRFAASQERSAAVNIGSVVSVNIEAFSGAVPSTTAVVEHVSPAVDAVSQLVFVEARLKIPAAWRERIRPGLTARCEVVR